MEKKRTRPNSTKKTDQGVTFAVIVRKVPTENEVQEHGLLSVAKITARKASLPPPFLLFFLCEEKERKKRGQIEKADTRRQ